MTRTFGFRIISSCKHGIDTVEAHIMAREEKEQYPINPRSSGESSIWGAPKAIDGLNLYGLTLVVYFEDGGSAMRGVNIAYREPGFIDRAVARQMVKTLDKVHKQLAKDEAEEHGDVLRSVATALGLTFFVDETHPSRTTSRYQDSLWNFRAVSRGVDAFREAIQDRSDRIKQRTAA